MNGHLEWMQQLGYAIANQQAAVLNSVQRLRRQAIGHQRGPLGLQIQQLWAGLSGKPTCHRPERGASSTRAKIYCSVLYAMLTR